MRPTVSVSFFKKHCVKILSVYIYNIYILYIYIQYTFLDQLVLKKVSSHSCQLLYFIAISIKRPLWRHVGGSQEPYDQPVRRRQTQTSQ